MSDVPQSTAQHLSEPISFVASQLQTSADYHAAEVPGPLKLVYFSIVISGLSSVTSSDFTILVF